MKHILTLFALVFLVIGSWSCQTNSGLTIEGQIANAPSLQAFIDDVKINKPSTAIDKVDMGADGSFSFNFPEGLPQGLYSLRIGAKRFTFALDGTESQVTINGDLNTIDRFEASISGSSSSATLVNIMQGLMRRQYQVDDIRTIVDTTSNPHVAAFLSAASLGNTGQYVDIQKVALTRLQETDPNSPGTLAFAEYISLVEQQAAMQDQRASGGIQVGQPAPDITMSSPDGTEYSLSDLRGQIVLLDFWASWCGPCRRENPNVVEVYNRYKAQGFTVFSVSLDGLDSRGRARYTPEELEDALQYQKNRWEQAIEQDGLLWPYHVSDLKKWECAAGRLYGVSSIPRTFLIDRDGNIAAVNLRGAGQIEAELQKLL
ncbi:MAG: TlpA family protein disulfide reductase [Lewinella sp.]|nr:TlpA family protein disulfide reductase [Lewinella sp.]